MSFARKFKPNAIYHVYNRGNNKRQCFFMPSDYIYFMQKLKKCLLSEQKCSLLFYCLMPNHYHLAFKAEKGLDISKIMQRLVVSYTQMHNAKYKHAGHVFQSKYKSRLVEDDDYFIYLSKYIHCNPAKFTNPYEYKYSSIKEYINASKGCCDTRPLLALFNFSNNEYLDFLRGRIPKQNETLEKILKESLLDDIF